MAVACGTVESMHTTLVQKHTIAEGTMIFYFAKPQEFTFTAGQYIDVTLIDPPETDAEGNTRSYSICAAPQEEMLAVATRMRDTAFKRTLAALPLGTEVSVEGPLGSFMLHENAARPAVCIAGGIGITPFRSMLLDATARKVAHQLILLYANRRPEDAAFLDELHALKEKNSNFTFVPTMSNMEHSAKEWQGERGHIDEAMLERYVPRTGAPIYYLAGPQGMVTAMRQVLTRIGVSADDIRFEEFSGY